MVHNYSHSDFLNGKCIKDLFNYVDTFVWVCVPMRPGEDVRSPVATRRKVMGQESQSSANSVSAPWSHVSSHGVTFSMNIFSPQMKQPQSQDKTSTAWTLSSPASIFHITVKIAVGALGPGPGSRNAYWVKEWASS